MPLIQFADCVRSIASTRLDWVGITEPAAVPPELAENLRRFDEVVTWYGSNRAEFWSALQAIHPRCVFHPALPGLNNDLHATDFYLEQVGATKARIPQILLTPKNPRKAVVIHPFSGSPSKNWPLAQYRELARQLPQDTEWTAGPEQALEEATRFENLLDLAHWLKDATAFIGNDSGIAHLAASLGVPSIVLFGPTDPQIWAPRGPVITISHQPLQDLPVSTVLEAVHRQIG